MATPIFNNNGYKQVLLFLSVLHLGIFATANIESSGNGDGSYCMNKIPRRSLSANCSSDSACEELLGGPIMDGDYLKCGSQGECVTTKFPKNEFCKDACESSECSQFCLQEYEAKKAMFCIETRDHPNARPVVNGSITYQNKYYCTCLLSELPYQHPQFNHRVVSRYLNYKYMFVGGRVYN